MKQQAIEQGLVAIEEMLISSVNSQIGVLKDASEHILSSGGKRVRPRLALLAFLAAGGETIEDVIPMAAAVEMVHTATLVHDDINDHSLTRRGKATVHAKWGRTFALLTGDYLFTRGYELMAPYGSTFNVIMADATTKLVEGETLQAAAAKAGEMDRETYKQVISLKTASLFEAASRMGAMLAEESDEVVDALATYGYNLGLTFQIVDDILDIVGDPEKLGKPTGTDLVQNRGVMMTQNGKGSSNGVETAVLEAVEEDDPSASLMAALRDSGAVEVARMQAREMASRARTALHKVAPSPARDEMERMIDLVLERDR